MDELSKKNIADLQKRLNQADLRIQEIEEAESRWKHMEKALRNSEERFRTLVANIPGAVFRCEIELPWRVEYISHGITDLTGYPVSRFVKENDFAFGDLIHPDDIESVAREVDIAVRTKSPYTVEYRILHNDGSWRWVHEVGRALHGADDTPLFLDGVLLDVTQRRDAEDKLRESEERFALFMEHVPAAVFLKDQNGKILFANKYLEDLFGWSDCVGKTTHDLLPKEIADKMVEDDKKSLKKGELAIIESIFDRHGARRVFETRKFAVTGAGEYEELGGVAVDITERMRTEEALREERDKVRQYLDLAGVMFVAIDERGIVTMINRKGSEVLGYSQEEILGKNWFASFIPERLKDKLTSVSRLLLDGKVKPVEYVENPVLTKSGEERIIAWHNTVLKDEAGKIIGHLSSGEDITFRKQAEEELRASEERYRNLYESMIDAYVKVDMSGRIVETNTSFQEMLGYSHEELREMTYVDLIPEKWHGFEAAIVAEQILPRGYSDIYEKEYRKKDGTIIPVELRTFLIRRPDGNAGSMWAIVRDISSRKRAMEEQLELQRHLLHAQKLESLGILAGGIAHDFNNLLMAILGNLDMALLDLPVPSPARSGIERSLQAAHRAADLTRQMLAYSGKGSFLVSPVDLTELAEENAHLFRASIPKTITLHLNLQKKLPLIEADAGQVQQIIMNLIANASEAIGQNVGRITLSTGVEDCDSNMLRHSRVDEIPDPGPFVFIEVADSGCGMDRKTRQCLFEPFFTTKFTGRGLGMSAILGIVRAHGGAIFLDSDPGRGTVIKVLFPIIEQVKAGKPQSARKSAEIPADAVGHHGTILVADDEEMILSVCTAMLEKLGFQVLTASDGKQAVEVFMEHEKEISVVFLDLSMPVMDGITALKEIHRLRPDMKVYLSSGFSAQEDSLLSVSKNLAGFIQKPYTLVELRKVLTGDLCQNHKD